MSAIGGDIIEISFSNPEHGNGFFFPKSGESFDLDPGGLVNDDDENAVSGDGCLIVKKTRKRWSIEGVVRWDMVGAVDLATYRALEESRFETEFTFSSINGTVWSAKGFPVGGNGGSMGDATFTVKFAGGGRCIKTIG